MDTRNVTLKTILTELHAKFGENQSRALAETAEIDGPESLSRVFFYTSEFLAENAARQEHEKLLARYLKEIFADTVCATYLAYSGLDTPSRTLIRRVLELGYVFLAYYDNPAKFWDWNSNDKDISFSELESILASEGYMKFISKASRVDLVRFRSAIDSLRKAYGELSNVVHPKPYNFETTFDKAFQFNSCDLKNILRLQEEVQNGLLKMVFCRFPDALSYVEKFYPDIRKRVGL